MSATFNFVFVGDQFNRSSEWNSAAAFMLAQLDKYAPHNPECVVSGLDRGRDLEFKFGYYDGIARSLCCSEANAPALVTRTCVDANAALIYFLAV